MEFVQDRTVDQIVEHFCVFGRKLSREIDCWIFNFPDFLRCIRRRDGERGYQPSARDDNDRIDYVECAVGPIDIHDTGIWCTICVTNIGQASGMPARLFGRCGEPVATRVNEWTELRAQIREISKSRVRYGSGKIVGAVATRKLAGGQASVTSSVQRRRPCANYRACHLRTWPGCSTVSSCLRIQF